MIRLPVGGGRARPAVAAILSWTLLSLLLVGSLEHAGAARSNPRRTESAKKRAAESTSETRAEGGEPPGAASEADSGQPAGSGPPSLFELDISRALPLEARLDSVRARFTDGRPPLRCPVRRIQEMPYLSLGDLGRLAGGGFTWDPESWRGSFRAESVDVAFVLDTAILWARGATAQMPAPVRYADETVWIPLAALDLAVAPLLRDRCRWDPAGGSWEVAGPGPWLTTMALSGWKGGASVTLEPIDHRSVRLRWDATGRLRIEAKGAHLPPGFAGPSGRAEGCEVVSVIPTRLGVELLLRLDPGWVGLRVREGRGARSVVIEMTSRVGELARGRFEPLQSYLPPRTRAATGTSSRRILLEISGDPSSEGGAACASLAQKMQEVLEKRFGHTVARVEDRDAAGRFRSPSGLPETPALPPGDCWVGLRIDQGAPSGRNEVLLVTPGIAPAEELLSASQISIEPVAGGETPRERNDAYVPRGGRLYPWGQAARFYEQASSRLARTMADHLNYRWEGRPVRISSRPARVFRGVAVPAVLVYPAAPGDRDALAMMVDPLRAEALANDLAFALDEFLASRAGE